MSTLAIERGWTSLSDFDREQIVRGVIYGENPPVKLAELVELARGVYGEELQRSFVSTLSRGVKHPSSGHPCSFSSLCVLTCDLSPLAAMAQAWSGVRIEGAAVTKSQWLDALSTRVIADGRAITYTLFEQAASQRGALAAKVMAFALEHQPGHPHIDMLMTKGGYSTSLVAEGLINRRLVNVAAAAAAAAAAVATSSPERPAQRRRASV